MNAPELALAAIVLGALTVYSVSAGADFGGGVWDLLARGRSAPRQRELIAHAIGPIWEANHVWLILVVVLLFVCFPPAFAAIATALHIPLTAMLLGVVLRGAAFTFRAYDRNEDPVQHRWGRVFAIASTITPVMLGLCVGAVASGRIRAEPATGRVTTDFFSSWLAPFPIAVGLLTLAMFAFLAAVYLTLETSDLELREAFRRRALLAALAVGLMAWVGLALAGNGAPVMRSGLAQRWWSLPFQLMTGATAMAAIAALVQRAYGRARLLAIAQAALMIWGWGLAQFPCVVVPDLTIHGTAAPRNVLDLVLVALAAGAVVLIPALVYLFAIFKGNRAALSLAEGETGPPRAIAPSPPE
jgi:cytochrome bd ubiquinol oxidase subunit II